MAADPRELIDQRRLNPHALLQMFREQSAIAQMEGYVGLRVVADTDWVLPIEPTLQELITFEVLLERAIVDTRSTAVCIYRRESVDAETIAGAVCLHSLRLAAGEHPRFSLTAADGCSWRLGGEVDLAVARPFATAFTATAQDPCVIDVSALAFIDVAGMRAIASVARETKIWLQLRGAPPSMRRVWRCAGFERCAPMVELLP